MASSFKLSALALFIGSVLPLSASAQIQGVPNCELATSESLPAIFGPMTMGYRDPHCVIKYTPDVAKYTGEGVKLGVVDNGFILDHQNLTGLNNIIPLRFTLHNPLANREDTFDGATDFVGDRDQNASENNQPWRRHGAGSIGPIVARPSERGEGHTPYAGGIAQNSMVYITSMLPNDRENAQLGKGFTTGDDKKMFSAQPASQASEYHVASYAGGIARLLQEKPLAINVSANISPVNEYKTGAEADAKYRNSIQRFADSPFIKAVRDAAAQETLMVISTGNEKNPQPGIYTLLPRYFNGLDKHMVAVTALPIPLDPLLAAFGPIAGADPDFANRCGVAKEWCITAPGAFPGLGMVGAPTERRSTFIDDTGTSIAAPVTTASLGVLKQRFNYMSSSQVRDTLFTTATDLGTNGVDETYGWGLINLEQGIKGPMQLLSDENYNVTQDDRWDNPLNANGKRLSKSGNQRLTLAGNNNQLGAVEVQAGTLALAGPTRSATIDNRATLEINNRLNGQITGSMQSETKFGANSHWVMPQSTTLGSVHMENGAQITLNSANAKAGGQLTDSTAVNTLTINNNLSGNGIFNFVTRLNNWVGDKVLVNGIANGNFQLNVQNSGAEPTDINRLTLLALRHGAQNEQNVNVSLVNPVDFGTYRYELIKEDNNEYRLYNPRKEQEQKAAADAEKRRAEEEAQRQAQAQEAERQEQARRLAEAERLSAERQTALNAERLEKENAQRELETARRTQVSQAEALQRAEDALRATSQLNERIQAQLTAEREAKAREQDAATALRTALAAEQRAKQALQEAKESAERAKLASDSEKDRALQRAQTALTQAEQRAEEARKASERATQAEQDARRAQTALDEANNQLATQQTAVNLAREAQQRAEQALEKQTEAFKEVQRAREEADKALQTANSEKADALKRAEDATRLAEQKLAEAERARQLSEEKTAELDRVNSELDQARRAQTQAEKERDEAQRQKNETESALNNQQNSTQSELATVRQSLNEARQQLAQKTAEAEKATEDKAAAEELARVAEIAKENALSDKAKAEEQARLAEQNAREAQQAKMQAEENARQANDKVAQAENEKAQALRAKEEADLAKARAEQTASDLRVAQENAEKARREAESAQAQTQALLTQEREARQQLEQAKAELESAQNGTESDLTQARLALRQAESQLTETNEALAGARLALQQAENEKAEAQLAVETAQASLAQANLAQAEARSAQLRAEELALNASLAQAQAEADKLSAEQAQRDAQAQLAQARLEQAKAEAESAEAQTKLAQAELLRAQAEADSTRIASANQALEQARQELEKALSNERQAREQAENENAILSASQNGTSEDLAKARLALNEAERQLAEKTRESEQAQQQAESARLASQQAEAQQAVAQENARLAELARQRAEAEKATAEANARTAEQARLQADAQRAQAEARTQQAEIRAENAQQALAQAEKARAEAEQARNVAQSAQVEAVRAQQALQTALENANKAKADVEQALGLSEAELAQARNALSEAEQALAQSQQALAEKRQEAEQAIARAEQAEQAHQIAQANVQTAQQALVQAEIDKTRAEERAESAELARVQAEADKATALSAKVQAEAEKSAALALQTLAENKAEQALNAQTEAENQSTTALADKVAAEKALSEAEQALNTLRDTVNRAEAQRQQAELISRYANSALSEVSAQVNVLEQISYSINRRLFEHPQSLSVSAEYNTQNLNQASQNYRPYQQNSDLKQVAVTLPLEDGVNVGVVVSQASARANFDNQASYRNKTQMVAGFVNMKLDEAIFAELDIGLGNSQSQIRLDDENHQFDRALASAGVRVGYSAEAFGVKLQPSVGLRYHHLGGTSYNLDQAEVTGNNVDVAGVQAGLQVEKSWLFGNATITPYFAGYYSDMSGQTQDIEVNGNPLALAFGRQFRHEIGLNGQYANWKLNAKAGVITGNDVSRQRYAGVKLNYQW